MRKKRYLLFGGGALCATALFLFFFFQSNRAPISVPIGLSEAKEPCFSVSIEGSSYWAGLDLGSKFPACLEPQVLDALGKKKAEGESKWRDIKGNFYTSPVYLLPKIEIGQFAWKNVSATQEESTWAENTSLFGSFNSPSEPLIQIGRPILERIDLFLDVAGRKISFCSDKKQLSYLGIALEEMVAIPFTSSLEEPILIRVVTDAGPLTLTLDTGATLSLIRASRLAEFPSFEGPAGLPCYRSPSFSMGGHDFGQQTFLLYEITPELDKTDGFLGMDFIEKHKMYIDYQDKVLYFAK